jgi:LmbE family N-acetylglucosaminyl deacetylase
VCLFFSPHPDDESIACAGVIQQALAAGAHVRAAESRAALTALGVAPEDIIFLGYPDFGTEEILLRYWDDTKPYRSMLPRQNEVVYADARTPNAPFAGESVLTDLRGILREYRPTQVYVSHPADVNRGHRALYVFTRVALWDVGAEIGIPFVYEYPVHAVHWPMLRGYHADLALTPPATWDTYEIRWWQLPLEEAQVVKKHDAIARYSSSVKSAAPYLYSFARGNELFGAFGRIVAREKMPSAGGVASVDEVPGIDYAADAGALRVRIKFVRRIPGG